MNNINVSDKDDIKQSFWSADYQELLRKYMKLQSDFLDSQEEICKLSEENFKLQMDAHFAARKREFI